MLQLGHLRVDAIHDGTFALDGGAMFGVVPRALWERKLPPDGSNRVRLALRCLLVRISGTDPRVVLVDTGMGDKWDDKSRDMYALDRRQSLVSALAALSVLPGEVTDVVLTHLHFDHAGGVTTREGALVFPRARHWVQRRNWQWAHAPSERDRGSYRAENFAALDRSPLLELVEGERELFPGFRVLPTEGHTPGLQCIALEGGGRSLLYPADLVPTSLHLKPAWGMSYDNEPLVVLREKAALLGRALRTGAVVVFEHDPLVPACTLKAAPGGFAVDREVAL